MNNAMYLALVFAIFSVHCYADESDQVFIGEDFRSKLTVDTPFCAEEGDRRLHFSVHYHSAADAVSADALVAAGRWGAGAISGWAGRNFCVSSERPYDVSVDSYSGGEIVATARYRASASGHGAPTFSLTGKKPVEGAFSGLGGMIAPVKDQLPQPGKFGDYDPNGMAGADDSFDYQAAAEEINRRTEGAGQETLASATYFLSLLEAARHKHLWRAGKVDPGREFFSYDGPEAEALLAEASALGNEAATLRLLRSTGMVAQLDKVMYRASQGMELVTPELKDMLRKDGSLLKLGIDQRVGSLVSLEKELGTFGLSLSADGIDQDPSKGPYAYAIELALNERLKNSSDLGDLVIGAMLQVPPGFSYRCDKDWCTSMNGLVSFRFSSRNDPECGDVVNNRTRCRFIFRIVSKVDMAGALRNQMLSSLTRASEILADGDFFYENDKWYLRGPIETRSN